jgi:hypothetical protein
MYPLLRSAASKGFSEASVLLDITIEETNATPTAAAMGLMLMVFLDMNGTSKLMG